MRNYLDKELTLTEEQKDVIDSPINTIIKGAGGTGKTITAIYLALKLSANQKVAIICYTRSLKKFIQEALRHHIIAINIDVYTFFSWEKHQTEYDVIIVDEVQDFSITEIQTIISNSKLGNYFFGDDAQQLYSWGKPATNEKPLSIDEIASIANFQVKQLKTNIRLSKSLLNFIEQAITDIPKSNAVYENSVKPIFHRSLSENDEYSFLENMCRELAGNTAILLHTNNNVEKIFKFLQNKRIGNLGFKVNLNDKLHLGNVQSTNILTFHSAKGLEFDNVLIPFRHNQDIDNAFLYVAFTRVRQNLIISYTQTISIGFPIPLLKNLYCGEVNIENRKKFLIKAHEHLFELHQFSQSLLGYQGLTAENAIAFAKAYTTLHEDATNLLQRYGYSEDQAREYSNIYLNNLFQTTA